MIHTSELFMGDPFIYAVKPYYYLIGTTDENEGFRAYKSVDLEYWEEIGFILHKNDTHFGDRCFWAPEVFRYGSVYYLTYSAYVEAEGVLRMAIAQSDSPEGPFHNLYAPWFRLEKGTIDSHIFQDGDGSLYLYFSQNWYDSANKTAHGENYMASLLPDLSGLAEPPLFVSRADQPWEMAFSNNRCNEGATVFKDHGEYYLTYSANDTVTEKYGIGYLKAAHPKGPWHKISTAPWFTTGEGILSPGHNSIFTDFTGQLKIVYHSLENPGTFRRRINISNLIIQDGKLIIK